MIRSHRIRLNPTPEQAGYLARAAGTRRFVFNWGLAEWKRQVEAGEKPSALALKKAFNAIKGEQYPWVYEVTKCVVEGAFMDLADAFKNFFDGRKAGRKVGYPKFKAKKRSREGFYLANDKFDTSGHWLRVPKLGLVNMAEKLRFEGKILAARVTRTADWWFVSIQVEVPDLPQVQREGQVGIDLGINRLATMSDGSMLENQKPLRSFLRKVKRLSRALSRKQKGSQNREKARRKLARLHYHIACIRDDLLHKATTALAEQYGFIGVESLHVKGMMHNHALAQALGDAAFGRFATFLSSKVTARGGHIQAVGRFFPSSKTCSCCGHLKQDLTLAERVFVCPACGFTLDRDWNAAINILNEALRLSTSSLQRPEVVDPSCRPVVATTDAKACGQLVRPSVLQPSGCRAGGTAGGSRRRNEVSPTWMGTFVHKKGSSFGYKQLTKKEGTYAYREPVICPSFPGAADYR